jgi:hypothetical protein
MAINHTASWGTICGSGPALSNVTGHADADRQEEHDEDEEPACEVPLQPGVVVAEERSDLFGCGVGAGRFAVDGVHDQRDGDHDHETDSGRGRCAGGFGVLPGVDGCRTHVVPMVVRSGERPFGVDGVRRR